MVSMCSAPRSTRLNRGGPEAGRQARETPINGCARGRRATAWIPTMARKKTGRRRGRPSLGRFAKSRQTTRRGRREGPDLGTDALRRHKRLLTGREDLPLDPAGVLLGRELIDPQQYSTLGL